MNCPVCGRETDEKHAFCPHCGGVLRMDPFAPTLTGSPPPAGNPPGTDSDKPSGKGLFRSESGGGGERLVPGDLVAGRYRIVGLLGRGGMGEVYRADDVRLGQSVALKILPEALTGDAAASERLHSEVRLSRQVSHPNVCRVFDIGEADGLHFLTMEYIDGEDLATLLRRIGRLPEDKAVEIARQICAGLAAAHDAGVLHRDLKPANVMIDGRGRARLMDFGLAAVAGEIAGQDVRSGTPAYMSPEQLAGKEVSVRSDVFSLGLVLYELFTGRKAFEAKSQAELMRMHHESSPVSPVSLVKELNPAIEQAVLRCLEPDQSQRPASALQVAAVLPGADPLAAALAAGETPSPELVAAAGRREGLAPRAAWSWMALLILGLGFVLLLAPVIRIDAFAPMDRPPAALADRAREVLAELGHTLPIADSAQGFSYALTYMRHVADNDPTPDRWHRHGDQLVQFWFRSSPRVLEPTRFIGAAFGAPRIGFNDPPMNVSGMALVQLGLDGRLLALRVVPEQVEDPEEPATEPDWHEVFRLAGLDPEDWTPTPSTRVPPDYADTRAAWTGHSSIVPEWPLRIEAAAYRGRIVHMSLLGPWSTAPRMEQTTTSLAQRTGHIILLAIFMTLMVGGALLARRNMKLGRGDPRGAWRLAMTSMVLWGAVWTFGSHHVPNLWEVALVIQGLSWALFASGFLWILYMAIEPYMRRRWPASLISWTRLLSGRIRDPLVGRDILIGTAAGAGLNFLTAVSFLIPLWRSEPLPFPALFDLFNLYGTGPMLAGLPSAVASSLFVGLGFLFLLVLVRVLLRRPWLATGSAVALLSAVAALQNPEPWLALPIALTAYSLLFFVVTRYGLLALFATLVAVGVTSNAPATLDFSAWYSGAGWFSWAVILAIALYGFRISLAGRPLFSGAAFDE